MGTILILFYHHIPILYLTKQNLPSVTFHKSLILKKVQQDILHLQESPYAHAHTHFNAAEAHASRIYNNGQMNPTTTLQLSASEMFP